VTAAPIPARRRPLDRVALSLLQATKDTSSTGTGSAVIGVTSVVDADDVGGRAVELSRRLALHSGSPTLLLEANLRVGSRLAAAMEMDAGPGLLDALRAPERADEAVRPTPDPRLWVMPAGGGAPSFATIGAADFSDVIATVRQGRWAVARRVLDLSGDRPGGWSVADPAPALASVGAGTGQPGEHGPPPEYAAPGEHVDVRPFNEGPPVDLDLPPLPPLPVPGNGNGHGNGHGNNGSTTPANARARIPNIVVVAPPMDDDSDGDIVTSQCDRTILLVHLGRVQREQLASAVERIGPDRLLGTVVVAAPERRRRR
jgi:hypothetical protein